MPPSYLGPQLISMVGGGRGEETELINEDIEKKKKWSEQSKLNDIESVIKIELKIKFYE